MSKKVVLESLIFDPRRLKPAWARHTYTHSLERTPPWHPKAKWTRIHTIRVQKMLCMGYLIIAGGHNIEKNQFWKFGVLNC